MRRSNIYVLLFLFGGELYSVLYDVIIYIIYEHISLSDKNKIEAIKLFIEMEIDVIYIFVIRGDRPVIFNHKVDTLI
jgi:hypothetical protein